MKWYGQIGYRQTVETAPSVYEEKIIYKNHIGDVTRNVSRHDQGDQVNDSLNVSNTISIVANPYAQNNFQSMVCIEFLGTKWKITNIDVQYPRIILSMGGVWNEQ